MNTNINIDVRVEWEILPAHEGTVDEIIPERIHITAVWLGKLNIVSELTYDEIGLLEAEISIKK